MSYKKGDRYIDHSDGEQIEYDGEDFRVIIEVWDDRRAGKIVVGPIATLQTWTFIGNFNKSGNFNDLYDKLNG